MSAHEREKDSGLCQASWLLQLGASLLWCASVCVHACVCVCGHARVCVRESAFHKLPGGSDYTGLGTVLPRREEVGEPASAPAWTRTCPWGRDAVGRKVLTSARRVVGKVKD